MCSMSTGHRTHVRQSITTNVRSSCTIYGTPRSSGYNQTRNKDNQYGATQPFLPLEIQPISRKIVQQSERLDHTQSNKYEGKWVGTVPQRSQPFVELRWTIDPKIVEPDVRDVLMLHEKSGPIVRGDYKINTTYKRQCPGHSQLDKVAVHGIATKDYCQCHNQCFIEQIKYVSCVECQHNWAKKSNLVGGECQQVLEERFQQRDRADKHPVARYKLVPTLDCEAD